MGECFITRRGGGAKAFAVIGVTYPEGSTCTCTDGTKTLKLKDTSGQGIFLIPYAATWTVTCTDGTKTKSESVEITIEGQSESVVLSYELWLYNKGVEFADITGGWKTSSTYGGSSSKEANRLYINVAGETNVDSHAAIYTNKKIDVSNFSTLHVNSNWVLSQSASGSGALVCLWNTPPTNFETFYPGVTSIASNQTSLDISKITGSYYIGFGGYTGGVSSYYVSSALTEVYLS